MHDEINITELNSLKECAKKPFFYILLSIMLIWGVLYSPVSMFLTIPFAFTLSILTVIDMKHMILPDIITLPMLAVGLALHYFLTGFILIPLLGAVFGFVLFFLVFYISYKIKGIPSMGFGDVKLLAMLGAWLGVSGLPLVLIYASLFAFVFIIFKTIYNKGISNTPFPYGPFLCLGGWLAFLYHDTTWVIILNARTNILNMIG